MSAAAGIEDTRAVFPTKRLNYLVALRRLRTPAGDVARPYIGLENIESGTGRLVNGPGRVAGSSPSAPSMTDGGGERDRFFYQNARGSSGSAPSMTDGKEGMGTDFEPGDVLFGKLRPYLAKAWVAEFPGRCTTEALVMEPTSIDPRFLGSVCLSSRFVGDVDASTFGSKMPRAEWDVIGNMPVPVPDPDTQRAIANYLDHETARLDALVAAKERLLKLLAEKRRAIVTRAVTRGLDPRVPLRDSGVPWLGEIPAHWKVKRARWLFHERDQRSEDGSEELLTVSHLTGVTPRSEKDVNMFEAETLEGYKICKPGDLVINTLWAWMGAMGVSFVPGVVSPAYNVYEPTVELDQLDPAYVDALSRLPVFAQEAARHSKGVWSSRLRLYPDEFFEIPLPVPPLSEQRRIVADLAENRGKLTDLQAAATRTIELLKERRTALVGAAVTGRLDVGSES